MNIAIYNNLAKLVHESRKIESLLDSLGAEGKGLWEKADDIKGDLPLDIPDKILCLAIARNKAIHGSPKIKDLDKLIDLAQHIHGTLEAGKNESRVQSSLKRLGTYNIDYIHNNLFDEFFTWAAKVKRYEAVKVVCSLDDLLQLDKDRESAINSIDLALEIMEDKEKYNLKDLAFNLLYIASISVIAYHTWKIL